MVGNKTVEDNVDRLCFHIMHQLNLYAVELGKNAANVKYRERYGEDKYWELMEEGIYTRMKALGEIHCLEFKALREAQDLIDDMDVV